MAIFGLENCDLTLKQRNISRKFNVMKALECFSHFSNFDHNLFLLQFVLYEFELFNFVPENLFRAFFPRLRVVLC